MDSLLPKTNSPPIEVSPQLFFERATKLHEVKRKLLTIPKQEREIIENRCSSLTQHDQLLDLECTALWLDVLRESPIINVDRLWGFKDTHFGAITLVLEGGMKAMFKPCTSSSEDTSKEVIASYLDQLFGWGQTAPVATRKIPVSLISDLVANSSENDFETLNETISRCATEDGLFVGPMIGWWNSLIPIRTIRKYKEEVAVLKQMRNELAKNPLTTQMQAKYHAFYWLIYILRHGKDEFITKDGDLVSLDLDRSRYKSTSEPASPALNYTWCYTCYMDEWVYESFQAVGPQQPSEYRLGNLMRTILSFEDIMVPLWDIRLSAALDQRVSLLLNCIDSCIATWGRENVLLNYPKTMSPKELVKYFVDNSVYKNQNGQRGPSNLEFLDEM